MGRNKHRRRESKTKRDRKKAKRARARQLANLDSYSFGILPLKEKLELSGDSVKISASSFGGFDTLALDLGNEFDQELLARTSESIEDAFGVDFEELMPCFVFVETPGEPGRKLLTVEVADSNFNYGVERLPIIYGAEIRPDTENERAVYVYVEPKDIFGAYIAPVRKGMILWTPEDQVAFFVTYP